MRTMSVRRGARIYGRPAIVEQTLRLSARMQDLHTERLRLRPLQYIDVAAVPFIRSDHRTRSPIRPVDVILENRYTKRMRQHLMIAQHQMMITARIIHRMYGVRSGIDPVDATQRIVQRQTVRPIAAHVGHMDDNRSLFAGHCAAFDTRIGAVPVRPEEQTIARIERNRSRTVHVAGDERPSETAIDASDFDLIEIAVHPVEIVSDPVDGQTFGGRQTGLDDGFDVLDGITDDGAAAEGGNGIVTDCMRTRIFVGWAQSGSYQLKFLKGHLKTELRHQTRFVAVWVFCGPNGPMVQWSIVARTKWAKHLCSNVSGC